MRLTDVFNVYLFLQRLQYSFCVELLKVTYMLSVIVEVPAKNPNVQPVVLVLVEYNTDWYQAIPLLQKWMEQQSQLGQRCFSVMMMKRRT